jgi:hypothetical protein
MNMLLILLNTSKFFLCAVILFSIFGIYSVHYDLQICSQLQWRREHSLMVKNAGFEVRPF